MLFNNLKIKLINELRKKIMKMFYFSIINGIPFFIIVTLMIDSVSIGAEIIKKAVGSMPNLSGIYMMLNEKDEILYIGKAKNLKKRVISYTKISLLTNRLRKMVSKTKNVLFTITKNESDALFLEADLIKTKKPQYNIRLRDSTPFVSVAISLNDEYPRIFKNYGPKNNPLIEYLGPFSSIKNVETVLNNIYKIFKVRNCSNYYFKTRKRPCLQYDIGRCSAPCVKKISIEEYRKFVEYAKDFLNGKIENIKNILFQKMNDSSEKMEFEKAIEFRNTIEKIQKLPEIKKSELKTIYEADIITIVQPKKFNESEIKIENQNVKEFENDGVATINISFIRNKIFWGGDNFLLTDESKNLKEEENLEIFLEQFYTENVPPKKIILNIKPKSITEITNALKEKYNKKIDFFIPKKGKLFELIKLGEKNANHFLIKEKNYFNNFEHNFNSIFKKFSPFFGKELKEIKKIEIYDNSHNHGAFAYGCFVVANKNGFEKKSYRKFKISGVLNEKNSIEKKESFEITENNKIQNPDNENSEKNLIIGDDYSMVKETFFRRFSQLTFNEIESNNINSEKINEIKNNENLNHEVSIPDLILLDGGAGQINVAQKILDSFNLKIPIIGIAKGKDRNAGKERFFIHGFSPFSLEDEIELLHFLQILRDEAHRFAIGTHRKAVKKSLTESILDEINGIGPKKKKLLIKTFGSVHEIKNLTKTDLMKVSGITNNLAEEILLKIK